MKNFKSVAMGFISGSVCMLGVTAFAANYQAVEALLMQDVTFKIDGIRAVTEGNKPVLNYNGYAYVPVSFVTEQLNADTHWDAATRTISIATDKTVHVIEKEVEKIVYLSEEELEEQGITTHDYKDLPVEKRIGDQTVEVTTLSISDVANTTKIFLTLENEGYERAQIIQSSAKLVVDGKEVDISNKVSQWDDGWETSSLDKDEEREGYLIFNAISEDYEEIDLEFDVRLSDGEINTFEFHFTD